MLTERTLLLLPVFFPHVHQAVRLILAVAVAAVVVAAAVVAVVAAGLRGTL